MFTILLIVLSPPSVAPRAIFMLIAHVIRRDKTTIVQAAHSLSPLVGFRMSAVSAASFSFWHIASFLKAGDHLGYRPWFLGCCTLSETHDRDVRAGREVMDLSLSITRVAPPSEALSFSILYLSRMSLLSWIMHRERKFFTIVALVYRPRGFMRHRGRKIQTISLRA